MLRRLLRRLQSFDMSFGEPHPDVVMHYETNYAGPGWSAMMRQLPLETIMMQGGSTLSNVHDRNGIVQDPEDPRHPIALIASGLSSSYDTGSLTLAHSRFEPITQGARLMQVLYENYLEPFSMNRVCAHLGNYDMVPNYHHSLLTMNAVYLGQTASLAGNVVIGADSVVLEGTTIKGDTNVVFVANNVIIMENVCIVSDSTTDLLAYRRNDALNPYQTWDGIEGAVYIGHFTIIEPNCYIDSCDIGDYNHIGHNCKLMKGVTTRTMVHILPGSVVTADTFIDEGEIWGGAPAVKVGKVSKNEWKRPTLPAMNLRHAVMRSYTNMSFYGDEVVHFRNAMTELDEAMIRYEEHVTPAVRAQIQAFVQGREPLHYAITRLSQEWMPSGQPGDKMLSTASPLPSVKLYAEHNTDSSDSELHGTYLNLTNIFNEYRW